MWGSHCRNLANTIEPFMCCGDAAFLSNYFDQLLCLSRWPVKICFLNHRFLITQRRPAVYVLTGLITGSLRCRNGSDQQAVAYSVGYFEAHSLRRGNETLGHFDRISQHFGMLKLTTVYWAQITLLRFRSNITKMASDYFWSIYSLLKLQIMRALGSACNFRRFLFWKEKFVKRILVCEVDARQAWRGGLCNMKVTGYHDVSWQISVTCAAAIWPHGTYEVNPRCACFDAADIRSIFTTLESWRVEALYRHKLLRIHTTHTVSIWQSTYWILSRQKQQLASMSS